MDYVQPIGAAAGAPYVDADPGAGTEGSPVPAAAIEHPMREIMAVITGAGLTPDGADRTQLYQAIRQMIVAAQKAVIISNATFEASVANGEVVRWDAGNNRFDEAVADSSANDRAVGIADVTNGKVYIYGECPLFAGLTPGARYYLDAATPGAIALVAPADSVQIGIAKSATTLFVDIDSFAGAGVTAPQFDASTKLATTLFLKIKGVEYSGVNAYAVSTPLSAAHAGSLVIAYGNAGPISFTLPPSGTLPNGGGMTFLNASGYAVTLLRYGTDQINPAVNTVTSLTLQPGDTLSIALLGSIWECAGGSAALAHCGIFAASLTANGYQKLPSGYIEQWGVALALGANEVRTVTLPISFPTGARSLVFNGDGANPLARIAALGAATIQIQNLGTAGQNIYWRIVGS